MVAIKFTVFKLRALLLVKALSKRDRESHGPWRLLSCEMLLGVYYKFALGGLLNSEKTPALHSSSPQLHTYIITL